MSGKRLRSSVLAGAVTLVTVVGYLGASGAAAGAARARPAMSSGYSETKLVSDRPGAAHKDTNLVNAWGLAAGPATPWWVADNGTSLSTIYGSDGTPASLVVQVPSDPTGSVYNGGPGFVVTHGKSSGPSLFLFDTEDGAILGWNPNVPSPAPSTKAFVVVNRAAQHAVFKGLAISSTYGGNRLYATDFHNARVDVFNASFHQINIPGAFTDPGIPAGYAPFGIQAIGGDIFVTYGKQDAEGHDEVDGPGLGFVDMYNTSGKLLGRVASHGSLNGPWGIAMAPSDFGRFSGDLLVGNFGNGLINAFRKSGGTWTHAGMLRHTGGMPVRIPGLWGLAFANGGPTGATNQLFFSAGPGDESHGLFGLIEATG